MWTGSPYLDSTEGTALKVVWKLRSIHLKEPKSHLQARETKQEGPKYCANVVEEELSVDISHHRPTRALFNFYRRPSVERISIVMHRPGMGSPEKGPVVY